MLTGMFAAELRVKNAVMPDSRRAVSVSGYGFRFRNSAAMNGSVTSVTNNMEPTRDATSLP